jgi:hypothetical protein
MLTAEVKTDMNKSIIPSEIDSQSWLTQPFSQELPWFLLGASLLSAVFLLLKKPRQLLVWLMPVGLAGAGTALYLLERRENILAAKETLIREELQSLDPLARVQVLIRLTEKELARINQ